MKRIRIKPSRPASALGMVVGLAFVGFGLAFAIPMFGIFGIIWTLIAVAIVVSQAINVFSTQGLASTVIDVEGEGPAGDTLPFDERLRRLERLREDQLIAPEEYERKRAEILGGRW